MDEEPFVFVIESFDKEGEPHERLLSCIERRKDASGIMEGIMLSASEREPVICVTGKHLTPNKVYDRFIVVIPIKAALIDIDEDEDIEYWEINDKIYELVNEEDELGYSKVTINRYD